MDLYYTKLTYYHMRGHTLEDTLMPKPQLAETFFPVKEKGRRSSKVASSSMSLMSSQDELPTWKPGKIRILDRCHP
jgi:hypothetical protein